MTVYVARDRVQGMLYDTCTLRADGRACGQANREGRGESAWPVMTTITAGIRYAAGMDLIDARIGTGFEFIPSGVKQLGADATRLQPELP
jgi:hypothetical protein